MVEQEQNYSSQQSLASEKIFTPETIVQHQSICEKSWTSRLIGQNEISSRLVSADVQKEKLPENKKCRLEQLKVLTIFVKSLHDIVRKFENFDKSGLPQWLYSANKYWGLLKFDPEKFLELTEKYLNNTIRLEEETKAYNKGIPQIFADNGLSELSEELRKMTKPALFGISTGEGLVISDCQDEKTLDLFKNDLMTILRHGQNSSIDNAGTLDEDNVQEIASTSLENDLKNLDYLPKTEVLTQTLWTGEKLEDIKVIKELFVKIYSEIDNKMDKELLKKTLKKQNPKIGEKELALVIDNMKASLAYKEYQMDKYKKEKNIYVAVRIKDSEAYKKWPEGKQKIWGQYSDAMGIGFMNWSDITVDKWVERAVIAGPAAILGLEAGSAAVGAFGLQKMALLATMGSLGLSQIACENQLSMSEEFVQNFNPKKYRPFEEHEYNKPNENPIKIESVIDSYESLIAQEIGDYVPIERFFNLILNKDNKLEVTMKIHDVNSLGALVDELFPGARFGMSDDSILISINENKKILFTISGSALKLEFKTDQGSKTIELNNNCEQGVVQAMVDQTESINSNGVEHPALLEMHNDRGDIAKLEKKDNQLSIQYLNKDINKDFVVVNNTETMVAFLGTFAEYPRIIEKIFGQGSADFGLARVNLKDVRDINQLIYIFSLLPKTPGAYMDFIKIAGFDYQEGDKKNNDEFRDPIVSLKSGWGDCDDYTVINYFWAYMHNYNPYVAYLESNGAKAGHVFTWYKGENGMINIFDNHDFYIVKTEEELTDFITKTYSGLKIKNLYIQAR